MNRGLATLGLVVVGTVATVWYVHHDQQKEIARMRESVYRDAERERFRRAVVEGKQKVDDKSER